MSLCGGRGVVGIMVCCGDMGVIMCRGYVVVVWSLWFVVVMWQTCGGIALLASCFGMKEGGTHRDKINGNDERRHRRRSSFGSHVAPSIPIAVVGARRLVTCCCHVVLAVMVVRDGGHW